jgi:hypothetical protein
MIPTIHPLPIAARTFLEVRDGITAINNLGRSLADPTGAPFPVLSFVGLRENSRMVRTLTATGGENGSEGGVMASGNAVGGLIGPSIDMPVVERAGGTMLRIPAGTAKVTLPKVGEFAAAWLGETEASPAASPAFEGRPLVANRIGLHCEISVQLGKQASGIAQEIAVQLLRAINTEIDRAAIRGVGTEHQPLGVLLSGITGIDCSEAAPTAGQIEEAEELVRDYSPGSESYVWVLSTRAARAFRRAGLFDANDKTRINGIPAIISGQMPSLPGVAADRVGSAVLGRWSDISVAVWDEIRVMPNPFIKDREGVLRLSAEAFADAEVAKVGSFVKLTSIALGE